MTRDDLIEQYGSIEEAKKHGYTKKAFSNEYVKAVGKGKANPRKYTRYPKGDPRHKSNSSTKK